MYVEGVESYCVGLEKHESGNYHLRCYLKFYDCVDCDYIRNWFSWFSSTVNVERCRSSKSWLIYITKEDEDAYHNVSTSKLSFYYRLYSWCRSTDVYKVSDPFVCEHNNKFRYIEEFYNEVRCMFRVHSLYGIGGEGGGVVKFIHGGIVEFRVGVISRVCFYLVREGPVSRIWLKSWLVAGRVIYILPVPRKVLWFRFG